MFKRLSILYVIIALLASTMLLSLGPEDVSAKKLSEMSPAEEAKSLVYYNAMRACVHNAGIKQASLKRFNDNDAKSGNWFSYVEVVGFDIGVVNPPIGYVLQGLGVTVESAPAEKVECHGVKAWIGDALISTWGYSSFLDAWCSTSGNSVRHGDVPCLSESNTHWNNESGQQTEAIRKNFDNAIKSKVYEGKDPPALGGAAKYLLHKAAFENGCGTYEGTPQIDSDKDFYYTDVRIVDISDGSVKKMNFMGSKKKTDKFDYMVNSKMDHEGISCQDHVKAMGENANAYADWVRIQLEEGKDVTEDTASNEVATCKIDGIGWIVCPVMGFLGDIADGSFNFLSDSFLETNSSVARADDGNPVYEAWKAMRNLANVLFVIAFIIIVYSQMTGAGISNYGVKRMLPRLVMAAIFVNISFFICQLAVDLSNVLGYSLKNFFEGLASNATGGLRLDLTADSTGSGAAGFFGGIVAIVLVSGSVYLFASALLPILLGAVVALVMILFILLARQALIILLIVVAPVAFVAFLLPNTQKLFTQWRKAFTAVMMVFPIIGVVFGVSMFASAVVTAGTNPVQTEDSHFWGQIIGAGIAVLPLFVVPGILKKSLDGVGNIGARINSIGGRLQGAANKKGAAAYGNSRLAQFKNYRAQNAARRRTLVQSGAYDGGNPLRRWTSAANKKLNESKISGKFGDRSVAKGAAIINKEQEELLNEEMATYEARPLTKLEDAKKNFEAAVKSGDSLKASAAIKVLSSMKTKGADEIKALLEEHGGKMPDNVMSATRSMLAGNADPVLNAMSFMPGSYEQLRDNPSTYKSLNAEKIAGMSASSIKHAMKVGGLDSQIVSSLLSPNSNYSLTSDQREALGGTSFIDAANAQAAEQSKPEYGSIDLRTRADAADQSLAEPAATDSQSQSVVQPENTNDVPPPQSGPTFTPPA